MDEMIRRITASASAQNEKTAAMHQNLDNISEINRETTSSSTHLSNVTGELNQLAEQLRVLVGQFKV